MSTKSKRRRRAHVEHSSSPTSSHPNPANDGALVGAVIEAIVTSVAAGIFEAFQAPPASERTLAT